MTIPEFIEFVRRIDTMLSERRRLDVNAQAMLLTIHTLSESGYNMQEIVDWLIHHADRRKKSG